jgi:hypothetical protein
MIRIVPSAAAKIKNRPVIRRPIWVAASVTRRHTSLTN